jgi:hypothetical protein
MLTWRRLPSLFFCTATVTVCSLYLQLQRLYRERADADVAVVESHLQQLLSEAGSPGRSIPTAHVKHFCKNARNIRVVRWVYCCPCFLYFCAHVPFTYDAANKAPALRGYCLDSTPHTKRRHTLLSICCC